MTTPIEIIEAYSYLVGGAVRDQIMGLPIHDKDYVVVGITPEQMISAGFEQVGADFPVFLHPDTKSEYALARTERKNGSGYKGFVVDYNTSVTVEDDLARRDLTINAIALRADGKIIDPFNGLEDIQNKILRATTVAFEEDPLRILRLARFRAKLGPDWIIEPQTISAAKRVILSQEFRDITPERVALEMTKALGTDYPWLFFDVLHRLRALEIHFPEIAALVGQTQPEKWHPEGDAYIHTLLVLKAACKIFDKDQIVQRFCALTHDLGKGLTPKEKLPHHYGHEIAGVPVVDAMCDRLKLSNDFRNAAKISGKWHGHVHLINKMSGKGWAKIAQHVNHGNLQDFINVGLIGLADARGRGPEHENYDLDMNTFSFWVVMISAMFNVKARDLFTDEELKTVHFTKIKDRLHKERIKVADKLIKFWKGTDDVEEEISV